MSILELDKENFEKEITGWILVDFWAPWCGPCLRVGPVLEQISKEKGTRIGKMDVSQNQEIAGKYGVRGIPTMIIFENEKEKGRIVGAYPKEAIEKFIEENK
ncbi:thioredoxin [Candidatus Micrarchaeota archaeon]|nr:thioredoxin [Candidatus Micrarchaeota archaeon]